MWHIIPDSFRTHWKDWEVRILVLFSLLLQIIMIPIGTFRKTTQRAWIQVLVWITYLTAESIPVLTLGVISNWLSNLNNMNTTGAVVRKHELFTLWAPVVLVHLGGPHTMTAYALEDNELWLRQLVRAIVQTGWTCYIYFLALSSSPLSYIAIGIILIGILKNFERTWSMFDASMKRFRKSLISPPQSQLFYVRLHEFSGMKKKEGYTVDLASTRETHVPEVFSAPEYLNVRDGGWRNMFMASQLIKTFKVLFTDLIGDINGLELVKSVFTELDHEDAFEIIDMELSLMFESLYTKAKIIYRPWGVTSKISTLLLSLAVLLAFCMVDKSVYEFKLDLSITFILILGLLLSEIHSIFNVISSDSMCALLTERKLSFWRRLVLHIRSCRVLRWLGITTGGYRWSGVLGQVSILGLAVNKITKLLSYCPNIKGSCDKMKQYLSVTYQPFDCKLRNAIYTNLTDKLTQPNKDQQHPNDPTEMQDSLAYDFTRTARSILHGNGLPNLMWIAETDFSRFIVIWHIVTETRYHDDDWKWDPDCDHIRPLRENSRTLSQYFIYLLVQRPTMWPIASAGDDYYAHTLLEARTFLDVQSSKHAAQEELNLQRICRWLLEVPYDTASPLNSANSGENKSVLFHASHFASQLKENCSIIKKQWLVIQTIWIEALFYIANHSNGDVQAKELIYGEELLTHIWLLMSHCGMSKQVKTSTKFAHRRFALS